MVELAKLEVEFISAWIDAATKLAGEDMEAQKALARSRLDHLLNEGAPVEPRSSGGSIVKGEVKGRATFLIYLGFYSFMVFGASIDDTGNPSLSYLRDEIRGDGVIALILFAIPLVVLLVRWRRSLKRARLIQAPE